MNSTAAVPVGIIDVAIAFPDVFGKVREELIHCIIAGDNPESMLPEQLKLWCEKHSITGKVRYRYEGTVDFGKDGIQYVGSGSSFGRGDDVIEPCCELIAGSAPESTDDDIPF